MYIAGIDIGGTKCAVVLGKEKNGVIEILSKEKFDTLANSPYIMLDLLKASLASQLREKGVSGDGLLGIGISCGGPLNSRTGRILSPPNLPLWDNIPITDVFEREFGVSAFLQNDANACAVAEWKYGAGRGAKNMIFLTFGTGIGAGFILNSRLYCGSNDLAGEVGHIRVARDGPVGYGKAGSLEGFCSGGGIAKLGQQEIKKALERGDSPALLRICGSPEGVTAKTIADLANEGDPMCQEIYRISGEKLGEGLSIIADMLDPDVIVIGSIFQRSHHLLWNACDAVMKNECLPAVYKNCRVVPSELGESIGDIAALAVVLEEHRAAD